MNAIDEYTNVNDHTNGNGYHHNGNGKQKVFDCVPTQDERLASTAPRLRTEARHTKGISAGAKVLFDELTDLSFLRSVSPQPGVVKMSKKVLAQELHVTQRTITRQARELEGGRFVWTRIVWECGFEITLWHIRGLADPQTELFHRPNPSYGSSRGRRERTVTRGTRGRFTKPPPKPVPAPEAPPTVEAYGQNCPLETFTVESAVLTPLSRDYGQNCPLATVTNVPGQGTPMSPAKGQNCPLPTVTNVRSQGTPVSEVNGHQCPKSTDANVPRQGTPVSEYKETPPELGDGEILIAVNRVNAPESREGRGGEGRGRKNGRPPEDTHDRKHHSENDFLQLCREVMGRWEIDDKPGGKKGNGGLWRTNFRTDKDRAWRVMREAESKKREGFKPDTTWAQYCMDLWIEGRV